MKTLTESETVEVTKIMRENKMKTKFSGFRGKQKYIDGYPVDGRASKIMSGEKILELPFRGGWYGIFSFSEDYEGEKRVVKTGLYAVARNDITFFDKSRRHVSCVKPLLEIYNKVG